MKTNQDHILIELENVASTGTHARVHLPFPGWGTLLSLIEDAGWFTKAELLIGRLAAFRAKNPHEAQLLDFDIPQGDPTTKDIETWIKANPTHTRQEAWQALTHNDPKEWTTPYTDKAGKTKTRRSTEATRFTRNYDIAAKNLQAHGWKPAKSQTTRNQPETLTWTREP